MLSTKEQIAGRAPTASNYLKHQI